MRELNYDELLELNEYELTPVTFLTVVMKTYGYSSNGHRVGFNVLSTDRVTEALKENKTIFLDWVILRMRQLKRETSEKHGVWIPAEPSDFEFRMV